MHLLLVTQALDRDDLILGFFHRWVEEFAVQQSSVTVIAQRVGIVDLPDNVTVHSLGKEQGASRLFQIFRFLLLIINLRRRYDAVFVHMITLWMMLGAPVWMFFGKRRWLWYAAKGGGWKLRMAEKLTTGIFTSTPDGLPIASAKKIVTGQGIDCAHFSPQGVPRDPYLLVTVGRITPAKHLDLCIDTVASLPPSYRLILVGRAQLPHEQSYKQRLMQQIDALGVRERISFEERRQNALPDLLSRAAFFLHASETTLDKSVLEAMACGCIPISCGEVARQVLPPVCRCVPETFPQVVRAILALPSTKREEMARECRTIVERDHGLSRLISLLTTKMAS